jgi:hypothetical protein
MTKRDIAVHDLVPLCKPCHLHKGIIQSERYPYVGHFAFIRALSNQKDTLMKAIPSL